MKFIKKLIVYGFGQILTKAISFLLIPLYTRYILPEAYGQADITYYTVSVLVSLVFMEIWTAFLKFGLKNKNNVDKIFTNTITISLIAMIPYVLVQSLFSYFISVGFVLISIIYGISLLFMNLYQMYSRITGNSKQFVISGISSSVSQIIVAVLLIFVLKTGAITILLAPTVGSVVAVVYLEIKNKLTKSFRFKLIDKKTIKKLLGFSIPLALNSIAYWAITNVNKYYAAFFYGYEEASYLSVVNKVTLVLTLVVSVYSLAWQESAFEQVNKTSRIEYYSRMYSIYLAIFTCSTTVLMTFFNIIFPIFIGKNYLVARELLAPTFLITYFSGIAGFFGQIFNAESLTKNLMIGTLLGFSINLVALFIFTKHFSLMVIPIIAAISFLLVSMYRMLYLNRRRLVVISSKENILNFAIIILVALTNYMISKTLYLTLSTVLLLLLLVFINRTIIIDTVKMFKSQLLSKN